MRKGSGRGLTAGDRVATLVSLSLTPLSITDGLERWDGRSERVPAAGTAVLFGRSIAARLPEGVRRFPLRPLFLAQELDSRASGLPVYWEGAVRTTGGRGYLELTGYAAPLRM